MTGTNHNRSLKTRLAQELPTLSSHWLSRNVSLSMSPAPPAKCCFGARSGYSAHADDGNTRSLTISYTAMFSTRTAPPHIADPPSLALSAACTMISALRHGTNSTSSEKWSAEAITFFVHHLRVVGILRPCQLRKTVGLMTLRASLMMFQLRMRMLGTTTLGTRSRTPRIWRVVLLTAASVLLNSLPRDDCPGPGRLLRDVPGLLWAFWAWGNCLHLGSPSPPLPRTQIARTR